METTESRGFLVVERGHGVKHWSQRSPERAGVWRPAVDLDYGAILRRYRGFEGTPWPDLTSLGDLHVSRGLAAEDRFSRVEAYSRALEGQEVPVDLIAMGPAGDQSTAWLPDGFVFCGFDYGHGIDDEYRCSLLYHEIIFGLERRLRDFGSVLNECLLLPSLDDVVALDMARRDMLDAGAALEQTGDDDPTGVVAIFARPTNPRSRTT